MGHFAMSQDIDAFDLGVLDGRVVAAPVKGRVRRQAEQSRAVRGSSATAFKAASWSSTACGVNWRITATAWAETVMAQTHGR
jgi:hypothetical protein